MYIILYNQYFVNWIATIWCHIVQKNYFVKSREMLSFGSISQKKIPPGHLPWGAQFPYHPPPPRPPCEELSVDSGGGCVPGEKQSTITVHSATWTLFTVRLRMECEVQL